MDFERSHFGKMQLVLTEHILRAWQVLEFFLQLIYLFITSVPKFQILINQKDTSFLFRILKFFIGPKIRRSGFAIKYASA